MTSSVAKRAHVRAPTVVLCSILTFLFCGDGAEAAEIALSDGNTAWVMTATALVLFMTLPGLALFYGGLVRSKNVLSVLMHCMAVCSLASVLWLIIVYSLCFGNGGSLGDWIGGLDKFFLSGVGVDSMSGDIPETVYFMFQMTFAIITPALIIGAYVERIRFSAVCLFSSIWLIVVYAPVCHWVWGGGWLARMGVMDFAGGLVVHVTAGISALVIAAMLGKRAGFPRDLSPPHSPGMVMTGAAMLWVGWYGFNAGSALAAGGSAGMAMTVTHISAATASLTWMAIEWLRYGRPSLVGLVTGTIAGLATITPASGFVGPLGGFVLGICAGIVCFAMVQIIKHRIQLDDSLDVFAVHGVGGALGSLLVAVFADTAFGGRGFSDTVSITSAFGVQLTGVVVIAVWSAAASFAILKGIDVLVGLRVAADQEVEGLDITAHGERGYDI